MRRILAALSLAFSSLPAFAAAYTYVASGASDTQAAGAAINPGAPAGCSNGDLLVAYGFTRDNNRDSPEDTGWTNIFADNNAQSPSLEIWARIKTGGADDAVTFDFDGASTSSGWVSCYTGDVYTDLATIVAHSNTGEVNSSSALALPGLTVTTDNTLIIGFVAKTKTATSNDATTVTTTAGTPSLTKRKQLIQSGTGFIAAEATAQETTATDYSGTDFTRDGTNESGTSDGVILSLKTASAATPTFTSAPAIGTRTTSSIPINFTSDLSGIVYGVRMTDGSSTPTCDAIEAQTVTGGLSYFSEVVVATVADSSAFDSLTDGTVTDGAFCIEAAGIDSTVATIANMYKLPRFTTALTIASQTDTAYTSNSKVLDGPGNVYMAACAKDASPPSVVQVEAQTGGCIVASSGGSDDATGTQTLTISGTPFPLYDIYYVGTYGSQHEAAVNALPDEFLDPPSGKQFVTLGTISSDSPLFGQTPTVASGDIWVLDTVTNTTGYVITPYGTGLLSIAAGGDATRQELDHDVYDVSLAAYYGASIVYINNHPPNVILQIDGGDEFFDGTLFEVNADVDYDLSEVSEDAEDDDIDFSVASGALPDDWDLDEETGLLSGGIPGACGTYAFTIRLTDITGDYTDVENTIGIGPVVPDVEGDSEAAAISAIEALCSLDAVAGTPRYSETVALGGVVETDPAIGEIAAYNATVTYVLSLGPSPITPGDWVIPNLAGMTLTQAEAAIDAVAPWRIGVSDILEGTHECAVPPEDVVASQDPISGATVGDFDDVTVRLAFIPIMPSLIGLTVEEATIIIEEICP